jgi:hypothetical protein
MADDRLACLCLRADYEYHRQVRLQVLDALEAIGQGGVPEGGVTCFVGFATLLEPLRRVAWPLRFRPDTSVRFTDCLILWNSYNSTQSPSRRPEATGMSWLMATKGEPRRWLWGLPPKSISSWRGLYECFIDKFTPLGPEPEDP